MPHNRLLREALWSKNNEKRSDRKSHTWAPFRSREAKPEISRGYCAVTAFGDKQDLQHYSTKRTYVGPENFRESESGQNRQPFKLTILIYGIPGNKERQFRHMLDRIILANPYLVRTDNLSN